MTSKKKNDNNKLTEQLNQTENLQSTGYTATTSGLFDLVSHYLNIDSLKREGGRFVEEGKKILKGDSEIDLNHDRRFKDPAWQKNGMYKRMGQSYFAFCQALDGLLEDKSENWLDQERAQFTVELVKAAFAPTNNLLGNPGALKHTIDMGGKNLINGMRNFIGDLTNNRGFPSVVDTSSFKVGENLASTPGAVVFRNEQLEIIQYKPTTKQVYQIPVLIMTPQVNKFYFLDLSPRRSFVEYLVSEGYQVFMVSWRNPTKEQSNWGLDNYCLALNEAVDAVRQICGVKQINSFGFCAGGITMSALLSYMIEQGTEHKINAISYAVTLLDFSSPNLISIMSSSRLLGAAESNSSAKGMLEGKVLASIFALLRPNDLIFNYWVNNYLMGNPPPSFDILAWNVDTTNLPAALHKNFLDIFADNLMAKPDALKVLGAPVDLSKIKQDAFVAAAINDHLTPWMGCYQSTQLLGGATEFVLSNSGHIAGLVNPVGNPKSIYRTGPKPGKDPEAWFAAAEQHQGSWWQHWTEWASTRSGNFRNAKLKLGSSKYPALEKAPGTYVFE